MKALAVIPTYNERDNLPDLVRAMLADPDVRGHGRRRRIARRHRRDCRRARGASSPAASTCVHRTGKRGLGRSYVEGLQRALATSDADLICQMDADWSHDPKYLPDDGSRACADHDVVIGSRYLHGVSVVNWPLRRIILSAFANRYIRAVTGLERQRLHQRLPLLAARDAGEAAAGSRGLGRLRLSHRDALRGARARRAHRRGADHLRRAAHGHRRSCPAACCSSRRSRHGGSACAICSRPAMTTRQRVVMVATSYPTVSRRHRGHVHGAHRHAAWPRADTRFTWCCPGTRAGSAATRDGGVKFHLFKYAPAAGR